MLTFIFDVDDTLYDQVMPFRAAWEELYGGSHAGISMDRLFARSRKYSDEAFALAQSGEITMEAMFIYRVQKAFEEFDIRISDEKALEFQNIYRKYQRQIRVSDLMAEMLESLKERAVLGVITNGPSGHQWEKVTDLRLTRWIPREHIFVSEDLGAAKPEPETFRRVEAAMSLEEAKQAGELYYIGDSWRNDIEGAAGAGWRAIWLNRRGHVRTGDTEPFAEVSSERELFDLLQGLSGR